MLSVVILTKNEEKNIEECLKSVAWCDEIIIVDDESEDQTLEKVKNTSQKLKVFKRKLNNDFAAQRNYGLQQASGDWVLFVDSDERISEELKDEILKRVQNDVKKYDGFYIKRKDFLFGKWLRFGEAGKIRLIRLVKKGAGKWERAVHEELRVTGEVGELKEPLLHYPHQTIDEFLKKINFYTEINAGIFWNDELTLLASRRSGPSLKKRGFISASLAVIVYPLAKFIKNYFLLLGFLDGVPGFLHATLMSFHSFLTRGKLWQLQHEKTS